MSWKNFKFRDRKEPLSLNTVESKTVAIIVLGTKSVVAQRELIVELMQALTEESYIRLYSMLGDDVMKKILISC